MTSDEPSPDGQGGDFYDQPGVLHRYTSRDSTETSAPNKVMEEPALLAEIGDPDGARVLDLGCGDASVGNWLIGRGAQSYLGIDGSSAMLALAGRTLSRPAAQIQQTTIETFDAAPGSFDLIVSRLALHYVKDVAAVFARCHRWLSPGGTLTFSVVHPLITSHDARASSDEPRTNWLVDDYFVPGARPQSWLGGSVTFYHRTIEHYFVLLTAADFQVVSLRECEPQENAFHGDLSEYRRRRRIPLFLLIKARCIPG